MARLSCVNSFKRMAAVSTEQKPDFSISWPGCGVMVFWQLGVLKGLSRHMDTSMVPMLGSSSGALVTALAACGVRPDHAAQEMQRLLSCESLRRRRLGLFGVLGDITRTWLDTCLPIDAGALLSRRSTVLVTRLPLLATTHITSFASKQDVVDVVMASAHLPLVLDGNWYALCRQQPVIDGGFWWWWRRCEEPYRVAGGAAPPPPQLAAAAAAAAARSAGSNTASFASAEPFAALTTRIGATASAARGALQGPLGQLWPASTPSAPPPPVSFCSPTSFLDFIAADVQRHLAPDMGLGGAAAGGRGGGGGGGVGPVCGPASMAGGVLGRPGGLGAVPRPPSAAASAAMVVAAAASGHGADLDRGRVRNLALAAATAAAGAAEGALPPPDSLLALLARGERQAHRPEGSGGSGAGGGNRGAGGGVGPAVLLVQPSDDDALTAGWRRYRRWRPDDMAAAWEMMRHGEAYGSGPLLRRLEQQQWEHV